MACTITACSGVGCRKEMREGEGHGEEEREERKEEVEDSVGGIQIVCIYMRVVKEVLLLLQLFPLL